MQYQSPPQRVCNWLTFLPISITFPSLLKQLLLFTVVKLPSPSFSLPMYFLFRESRVLGTILHICLRMFLDAIFVTFVERLSCLFLLNVMYILPTRRLRVHVIKFLILRRTAYCSNWRALTVLLTQSKNNCPSPYISVDKAC